MAETATAPAPAPAPALTPPPAPAAAPPAAVELRVPSGVTVEADYINGLRDLAGKHGLDSPKAQAILDFELSRRAANAKAAETAQANIRAEWDAALTKEGFVGPKLAEASDRIAAYVKTHIPDVHQFLIAEGNYKFLPLFRYFEAASRAAAESGNIRTAVAPAPAAAVDPNDWTPVFDHPTSKAAFAAERR